MTTTTDPTVHDADLTAAVERLRTVDPLKDPLPPIGQLLADEELLTEQLTPLVLSVRKGIASLPRARRGAPVVRAAQLGCEEAERKHQQLSRSDSSGHSARFFHARSLALVSEALLCHHRALLGLTATEER